MLEIVYQFFTLRWHNVITMGAAENFSHSFQYLYDSKGKKSHVVVPIHLLEEFLEDIQDSRDIEKLKNEPTISFDDFVAELKEDGKI